VVSLDPLHGIGRNVWCGGLQVLSKPGALEWGKDLERLAGLVVQSAWSDCVRGSRRFELLAGPRQGKLHCPITTPTVRREVGADVHPLGADLLDDPGNHLGRSAADDSQARATATPNV
jgi:hypothetical protein